MAGKTMTEVLLALNAGSSSLKFSLFTANHEVAALSLLYRGEIEGIGSEPRFLVSTAPGELLMDEQLSATLSYEKALSILLEWIERHEAGLTLIAVGHRVVHGGTLFTAPVLVDAGILS